MTVRHLRRSVALASLCSLIPFGATCLGAAPRAAERAARDGLFERINLVRQQHGQAPLRLSSVLSRPARAHSAFVAATGRLQHADRKGRPFHVRLHKAGYPSSKWVGENLAIVSGCDPAATTDVVAMWLESPTHRRVLLSQTFVTVGIGVVSDPACRKTCFTADFGG